MANKIDYEDYVGDNNDAADSFIDMKSDLDKFSGQLDARRRLEQLKEERELERLINSNVYDDYY